MKQVLSSLYRKGNWGRGLSDFPEITWPLSGGTGIRTQVPFPLVHSAQNAGNNDTTYELQGKVPNVPIAKSVIMIIHTSLQTHFVSYRKWEIAEIQQKWDSRKLQLTTHTHGSLLGCLRHILKWWAFWRGPGVSSWVEHPPLTETPPSARQDVKAPP